MARAEPCQAQDDKYEKMWKAEKPKIEESYTIVELDTDAFNKFCDELAYDKPRFITDQKITIEQIKDTHIIFIPAPSAWPYHLQFKTDERSPIFVILKDCDKAKYAAFQVLTLLGHNVAG